MIFATSIKTQIEKKPFYIAPENRVSLKSNFNFKFTFALVSGNGNSNNIEKVFKTVVKRLKFCTIEKTFTNYRHT